MVGCVFAEGRLGGMPWEAEGPGMWGYSIWRAGGRSAECTESMPGEAEGPGMLGCWFAEGRSEGMPWEAKGPGM